MRRPDKARQTVVTSSRSPISVWMPAIRAGSGSDVFTQRLATGLEVAGVGSAITWLPHWREAFPLRLSAIPPPKHATLIHANSWTAHAFLGHRIPLVTTVHHLVHDPAYAPFRSLAQAAYHQWIILPRERRACLESDAVVVPSEYVAATVHAAFGVKPKVIPNWVDTRKFSPAPPDPEREHHGKRRVRLLWVGNRSKRKGFDLLPSIARLLGARFEIRCTGGLRGDDQVSSANGLTFLGRLSEAALIQEYRDCDIVLSTSRYEGFGYTALEGMACGKPVVAFETSALMELIRDGTDGLLAPPEDLDALVNCCTELLDPVRRQEMGLSGRLRAVDTYSTADAIRKYVALYEEAIRRRAF